MAGTARQKRKNGTSHGKAKTTARQKRKQGKSHGKAKTTARQA